MKYSYRAIRKKRVVNAPERDCVMVFMLPALYLYLDASTLVGSHLNGQPAGVFVA